MADGMQKPLEAEDKPTGLDLLRAPFPANAISKLPKETRAQIDERKQNRNAMVWNCPECGGHHHKNAVHLDYVGHAALTDRLLDADPAWTWEPVVMDGLPNPAGGMWIKLTVCGVSRLGYGSADGKSGGDAIKEIIGDALRNAAMRFGAALDLWHKGDLHPEQEPTGEQEKPAEQPQQKQQEAPPTKPQRLSKQHSRDLYAKLQGGLRNQSSVRAIRKWLEVWEDTLITLHEEFERDLRAEAAKEIEAHEASDLTQKQEAGF